MLRRELCEYMDPHAGQSPPTTSALYSKLGRADFLRLLEEEKSAREEQLRQAQQQEKEGQLRRELCEYMDAHAGQSPPTTSALYSKLRRADLLRLLEEEKSAREEQLRQAQQQEKEGQLRRELCEHMDAHAGQSPPTSALYGKLRRADLLRLLEEEKSAREEQLRQAQQQEKEGQLRRELCEYMDAHAGQSPPTTSALYTKLRRAYMLRTDCFARRTRLCYFCI